MLLSGMERLSRPSGMEVSVSLLLQMARYLESLRIDPRPVVREGGLSPSILDSPDARLPAERYIAIQERAAVHLGVVLLLFLLFDRIELLC
jgi:hypothetical protein